MKNRLILILAAGWILFFFSCSPTGMGKSQEVLTTINGNIEGGEGKQLFINKITNKSRGEIIDTITIGEDGKFSHRLNQPLKLDYYVITSKNRQQFYLITDSTEQITINASYDKIGKPTEILGSPNTEVYREIFEIVSTYRLSLEEIEEEILKAKTIPEKQEIAKQKNTEREKFRKTMNDFIDKNSASAGLAAFFDAIDFTKEPKLSAKVINSLAKTVPYTTYYKAREPQVKQLDNPNVKVAKRPDIGKVAPNIVLDDPNGKELSLYELRGKTVLIDFWASWCGPCRRENPNVVKAYNKYHDAGFEVLSVSLDNNKDKWIQAIEKDGLIWSTHVSDLLKWDTPYKEIYKFSGIPHTVLVGADGVIIDSKIRGAKLEERLEEIYGY